MGQSNPYEGRWRYWYVAIIDWMLSNPGRPLKECAAELGRGESTIYMITETDLFKTHFQQRRLAFSQAHDSELRKKMTSVATKSLDILAEVLDKKRDVIPVAQLTNIATSALDRLGYSPNKPGAAPGVVVNMPGSNPTLVTSVSREELEEARTAMRLAQQNRAQIPLVSQILPTPREAGGAHSSAGEASRLEAASADPSGFVGLDSAFGSRSDPLEAEEDSDGSFTLSTE